MSYDENERTKFEDILRERMSGDVPAINEAVMVAGIMISEWILPNGRRFLSRTPVGDMTQWQVEGYLISTLMDSEWRRLDDENPLNDEE
jgi:hypothetical protein